MKILIQKVQYDPPKMCASCATTQSENFYVSEIPVESHQNNYKVKTTLRYLICQSCEDAIGEIKRSFRPAQWWGFGVGFLTGLLVLFIPVSLIMRSPNPKDFFATQPLWVMIAFPLCAVGGCAWLGWRIAARIAENRSLHGNKQPGEAQEKIRRTLKPIQVIRYVAFQSNKKIFVRKEDQVYQGYIILNAANDQYARALAEANQGEVLTLYCGKCGKEIEEQIGFNGLKAWIASVCVKCMKVYCPECLEYDTAQPCPVCGETTEKAEKKAVAATGLFTKFAQIFYLYVSPTAS
jgi:hypothetical protein